MRISSQTQVIEGTVASHSAGQAEIISDGSGPDALEQMMIDQTNQQSQAIPKDKLELAVHALNEFMEINYQESKFVMHEELNQYFVQVVDAKTNEVIREVPPKKLLDAFYTMQKFVGMIVDEKI